MLHRRWLGWLVVLLSIGAVGADRTKVSPTIFSQPYSVNESAIFTKNYIYMTEQGKLIKFDWNLKVIAKIPNIKYASLLGDKIAILDDSGIILYNSDLKKEKTYKFRFRESYNSIIITSDSIIYSGTGEVPNKNVGRCSKITSFNYIKNKENWMITSIPECNPNKKMVYDFDRLKLTQKYIYLGAYGDIWPKLLSTKDLKPIEESLYNKVVAEIESMGYIDIYTMPDCKFNKRDNKEYTILCGKKTIQGHRNAKNADSMEFNEDIMDWRRVK